jgi:hypothetical protein
MAGYEVLAEALKNPETGRLEDVSAVAEAAGVSDDTMYRWLRRPSQQSDPNATGRKNPIDYFLRLLRAVYTVSPCGARLIIRYILGEFARLEAKHGHEGPLLVAWPSGSRNEKSEVDQEGRGASTGAGAR